jgi:hypothetical protein
MSAAMLENGRGVRDERYIRCVDPRVTNSGDGRTWARAYKTITEGIAALNALGNVGATLLIAPGFYLELSGLEITVNDVAIYGIGLPEDTVLFGTGTAGAVAAATDHLLTISGGNCHVSGLTFYNHKSDKDCIHLDGTAGDYHGGFNIIEDCYFSPQAQDGFRYAIHIDGGACNIIRGCTFEGAATAGIYMSDTNAAHNPSRTRIEDNVFSGCNIGISLANAVHQVIVWRNLFCAGNLSGETMTNAITGNATSTGRLVVAGNWFEQTAVNDISDSGALTITEFGNSNTS